MEAASWVRSKDGKTVHLSTCRYAATGVPWTYADGLDIFELADKLDDSGLLWNWGHFWLKWCGVCLPDGLPDDLDRILFENLADREFRAIWVLHHKGHAAGAPSPSTTGRGQ